MDPGERSHQVQLIGKVFRSAGHVIAWVGAQEECDYGIHALRLFESIGRGKEVDWNSRTMQPAPLKDNRIADLEKGLPLVRRQVHSVQAFLLRPWFIRLWVQQEILRANQNAILAYGSAREYFRKSIFHLRRSIVPDRYFESTSDQTDWHELIDSINSTCSAVICQHFHERLYETTQCLCSDPRDRIYAFLSVHAQGFCPLEIQPGYNATVAMVYQQATLQVLKQVGSFNIDLLSSCELRSDAKHAMPSWVPDFSVPKLIKSIGQKDAGGLATPDWVYSGDQVLRVKDTLKGRLHRTQQLFPNYPSHEGLVAKTSQSKPSAQLDSPYVGGGTMIDAYCDTFVSGSFADKLTAWRDLRNTTQSEFILRRMWEADDDLAALKAENSSNLPYFWALRYLCKAQVFCTTEEGLIVLAPATTKPDDQICILFGCSNCIILRPTGQNWKIVGECYVPGMMADETLLGSLPPSYRSGLFYSTDLKKYQ